MVTVFPLHAQNPYQEKGVQAKGIYEIRSKVQGKWEKGSRPKVNDAVTVFKRIERSPNSLISSFDRFSGVLE